MFQDTLLDPLSFYYQSLRILQTFYTFQDAGVIALQIFAILGILGVGYRNIVIFYLQIG